MNPPLVLASGSPRRRWLLAAICPEFAVVPSAVEESLAGPDPGAVAVALAERKARAVAAGLAGGVVLGADTIVVLDGEALGKPDGADEARTMLRRLRDRAHEVVTGVAVVDARTGAVASITVVSRVLMAACPDALIEAYVATGQPLDKAGGYAIQDLDGALVAAVVGPVSNVIGLPLAATRRLLVAAGVPVSAGR
jgi:septum formation protein